MPRNTLPQTPQFVGASSMGMPRDTTELLLKENLKHYKNA
jgi:hypothetical protein